LDNLTTPKEVEQAANKANDKLEAHVSSLIDANPDVRIQTMPLQNVRQALAGNGDITFLERGLKALERFQLGYERAGGVIDPPLTLRTADDLRWRLNREMEAVMKKNNYDRATARATDPGFAAAEAAAEALRDGVYDGLKDLGHPGIDDIRRTEGSLIKIRNAANRVEYKGEKPVAGTGKTGPVRNVVAKGIKVGAAGLGAEIRGVPGAIAGGALGDVVADAVTGVNPLTRNQLIERSFSKTLHPQGTGVITGGATPAAATAPAGQPTPGQPVPAATQAQTPAATAPANPTAQPAQTATATTAQPAAATPANATSATTPAAAPEPITYRTDNNGIRWAKSADSPAEVSVPKNLEGDAADAYARGKIDLQKEFAASRKAPEVKTEPKPAPKVEVKAEPKPEPKAAKPKRQAAGGLGVLAGNANAAERESEGAGDNWSVVNQTPEVSAAKAETEPADIPSLLDKAAREHGVPPEILHAQARQESGLNPDAVSPKGATGVMQLMPATADQLGVDPEDPAENINGGAQYLKQMRERFGSYDKALAAYNAGPERVQKSIELYHDQWLEHMPKETRDYVHKILRQAAK
jgi:soluble lytic murein transglycosylase-like protein